MCMFSLSTSNNVLNKLGLFHSLLKTLESLMMNQYILKVSFKIQIVSLFNSFSSNDILTKLNAEF